MQRNSFNIHAVADVKQGPSPSTSHSDIEDQRSDRVRKFNWSRHDILFVVLTSALSLLFVLVFLIWSPAAISKDTHTSHLLEGTKGALTKGIASTPFAYSLDLSRSYDIIDLRIATERKRSSPGRSLKYSILVFSKSSSTTATTIFGPALLPLNSTKEAELDVTINVRKAIGEHDVHDVGEVVLSVETQGPGETAFLFDVVQMGIVGRGRVAIAAVILSCTYILMLTDVASRAIIAMIGSFAAVAAVTALQGTVTLASAVSRISISTLALMFGMMIMVGCLSETGFIEWLAVHAAVLSKGNPWRLVLIMGAITWVMGALMDCVTTVLVVVPITLSVCRILEIDPTPLVISLAIFGNVGGAATLIGDPPNIILGYVLGFSFQDFLIYQAPGIILATIPLVIGMYFLFGRKMKAHATVDFVELQKTAVIHDPPKLAKLLVIISLALLLMFLTPVHKKDIAWIAVVYAVLVMLATCPKEVGTALSKVDWECLLYLAGLFVLVECCNELGLMKAVGKALTSAIKSAPEGRPRLLSAIALLIWVSAAITSVLDNSAYTLSMTSVLKYLAADLALPLKPLAFSLSMGACLGANATIFGAAANSVVIGLAKAQGLHISTAQFSKLGVPFMFVTVATASIYALLAFGVGGHGS